MTGPPGFCLYCFRPVKLSHDAYRRALEAKPAHDQDVTVFVTCRDCRRMSPATRRAIQAAGQTTGERKGL